MVITQEQFVNALAEFSDRTEIFADSSSNIITMLDLGAVIFNTGESVIKNNGYNGIFVYQPLKFSEALKHQQRSFDIRRIDGYVQLESGLLVPKDVAEGNDLESTKYKLNRRMFEVRGFYD
jgi:hypothetical protein